MAPSTHTPPTLRRRATQGLMLALTMFGALAPGGCAPPAAGLFIVVHSNIRMIGRIGVTLMGDTYTNQEQFDATRNVAGEGSDVVGTLGLDAPDPFVEGSFLVTVSVLDAMQMNMPTAQQVRQVTLRRDTVLRMDAYLLQECLPPAPCSMPNMMRTCGIAASGIAGCIDVPRNELPAYVRGSPPPGVTLPGFDAGMPPH